MGKLLGVEILLMIMTGLAAMTLVPWSMGRPSAWPLFAVGFLMAMSFVALYALGNLSVRRMGLPARTLLGLAAFVGAFWGPLLLSVSPGTTLGLRSAYSLLAPPVFGLILCALSALRAPNGERWRAAVDALIAYALPALGIRYLLVPLVQVNPTAQQMAIHAGAIYLFMRGLIRIYLPSAAEGNDQAGPLVYRPIPDRIVGLVEGTTRRRARPYASRPDGTLDETAISILCRREDLPGVTAKLQTALAEQPFLVETGVETEKQIELVIRPAPAGESVQS